LSLTAVEMRDKKTGLWEKPGGPLCEHTGSRTLPRPAESVSQGRGTGLHIYTCPGDLAEFREPWPPEHATPCPYGGKSELTGPMAQGTKPPET
jgi:hypothetical protein